MAPLFFSLEEYEPSSFFGFETIVDFGPERPEVIHCG
jgi:hypothetical protein